VTGLSHESVSWRKISIALIKAEKGEVKAQACDKA
jgi:hypothetical protein